jgi:hypothetical protein
MKLSLSAWMAVVLRLAKKDKYMRIYLGYAYHEQTKTQSVVGTHKQENLQS